MLLEVPKFHVSLYRARLTVSTCVAECFSVSRLVPLDQFLSRPSVPAAAYEIITQSLILNIIAWPMAQS